MAVTTDHQHAGPDQPLFRQHHMADPHLGIEMRHAFGGHPVARQFLNLAAGVVMRRHIMVSDDRQPVRVLQRPAQRRQLGGQPPGTAAVMHHRQIDTACQIVARTDARSAAGAAQDFFNNGWHIAVKPVLG